MSKLLYKYLKADGLREILRDIKNVCGILEIDFFGVGALARNIWFVQNDEPARGTKDIDFAVFIPNDSTYSLLKRKLIDEYEYVSVKENAFCLIAKNGIQVDLLPFGAIEQQEKVVIEGKGLTTINLDGFQETYNLGLVEVEIEGDTLKACSIPAMIILKLIAFDDRPYQRPKDPLDINSIFNYYPQLEDGFIWEKYFHLYTDEKSHEQVGIEVLGYEINKIIKISPKLRARILNILDKAILQESDLALLMIQNATVETINMKVNRLKWLQHGILNE